MIPRSAAIPLRELTRAFRVVVVHGPRQAGKSTLLDHYHDEVGGTSFTLDDIGALEAAKADPTTLATSGGPPWIIDEVQRGGDALLLAIKRQVDGDNSPGQYVLAGSTNFLATRAITESLAGRAGFVTVWPFTVAERTGQAHASPDLRELAASTADPGPSSWTRADYAALACEGGLPEPLRLPKRIRRPWYDSYLDSVILRDIAEFAQIQRGPAVPRLLAMIAARAGSQVVVADLARSLAISPITVNNYLGYLEGVFLTVSLPAWSTNLNTRAARSPRLFVSDPGLAAHAMGATPAALAEPGAAALGPLLETTVVTELTRLIANDPDRPRLGYYRDHGGREIDIVAEYPGGQVVAIEVKASTTPRVRDARHLQWLRDELGDRFAGGIVLHLGPASHSLGDRIRAIPVSALWGHRPLLDADPAGR